MSLEKYNIYISNYRAVTLDGSLMEDAREAYELGYDGYCEKKRTERNILLAETDWWALSDRTMTQAEIDYRQALRDVTAQEGFPTDITWPTKP